MITPIYIMMNAKDQLLLSETVCQQLRIVSYHSMVEVWGGGHRSNTQCTDAQLTARVPDVRVKLVQATQFLPQQTTVAQAYEFNHESILLEAKDELEADTGLQMDTSTIKLDDEGNAFVLITNTKGYSLKLKADTEIVHVSNVAQALEVG